MQTYYFTYSVVMLILFGVGLIMHDKVMQPIYRRGIIKILSEKNRSLELDELLREIQYRGGTIRRFSLLLHMKKLEEEGLVRSQTKRTTSTTGRKCPSILYYFTLN
ncbi:MAG: winged-helix domain-containing protein [Candidatus Paceibacterota bacterium]